MRTWTIDFQGTDGTRKLRGAIEERIAELAEQFDAIRSCRVMVKGPPASKRPGQYEVDIQLTLAVGADIKIGRSRGINERYDEVGFAIDDTFRRARRRLKDRASGRAEKSGKRKRGSPTPPSSPGADAAVPAAANPQNGPAFADVQADATSPPPEASRPAEIPTARGDALRDRDAQTSDISPGPLTAETGGTDGEEPAIGEASVADTAADAADTETAVSQATEPALEGDAAEDASADAADTEAAVSQATEPALEGDAAEDASAEAAATETTAPPSSEPGQAVNLNPLFMALAVGTALTAAATLNASATWARLLKNATEGKSSAAADTEESGEAQSGAGRGPQSGSE